MTSSATHRVVNGPLLCRWRNQSLYYIGCGVGTGFCGGGKNIVAVGTFSPLVKDVSVNAYYSPLAYLKPPHNPQSLQSYQQRKLDTHKFR